MRSLRQSLSNYADLAVYIPYHREIKVAITEYFLGYKRDADEFFKREREAHSLTTQQPALNETVIFMVLTPMIQPIF